MLENVFRTMTMIKKITIFIYLTILLPVNLVASELSKSPLASKTESVAAEVADKLRKYIIPLYLEKKISGKDVKSSLNNLVYNRQDGINLFADVDTGAKAYIMIAEKSLIGVSNARSDEERDGLLTRLQEIKLSPEQIEVARNAYASVPDFNRFAGMMYREGLWTASFTREEIAKIKELLSLPHKTASVPPSTTAAVSPSMPTELAQGSSQEDSEIVTLSEIDIDTQIARVKNFSQQAGPVNLLLGAVNTKAIHGKWVFLDHEAGGSDGAKHDRTSEGRPYIIGSFNDLDLLEKLAANLESCFDTILLDDSTFKFTKWNIQKLACFAKMLKPGGAFIFCPRPGLSQILEQEDYQKQFNDRKSAISRVASGGVTENDYLETSSVKIESITAENPYYTECMLPFDRELLEQVFDDVSIKKHKGFPITTNYTPANQMIDLFVCIKTASASQPAASPMFRGSFEDKPQRRERKR